MDIDFKKFQDAQKLLEKSGLHSPLVPFASMSASGHTILLKTENLQPSGSFKIRGAVYCLSRLSDEQKARGVIAYSTGNHAQAVALAARSLGIKATVVMSPEAPAFKVSATKEFGAVVVMSEPSSAARRAMAEDLAKKHGYYLVPPYDNTDIIVGQGTIAVEILDAVDPAAIFVPIGGGGLIAGVALAVKKSGSSAKVIGVEPELENDAVQSFKCGKRVSLPGPSKSIADAIKVQTLGDITYPIIRDYVDDIVSVSEKEIIDATLMHAEKAHLLVEPTGALALAAALTYQNKLDANKPLVCIVSGGNFPCQNLCQLLSR